MADIKEVVTGLECCYKYETHPASGLICEECPYNKENGLGTCSVLMLKDALELLKEQEPRELTKEEWEQWKKDERRDPICMIWYGDTTPFWVLRPEEINEPLYLMGKIKLFTKKPPKEQVKWNE